MSTLFNENLHYVKFMRGSVSAWEALQATPDKISNDTLYFIYSDAQTSKDGKLYLGQKLISGDQFTEININQIGDIYIDNETLADKQILVYNETSQQWENTSLSTIINSAVGVMQGATTVSAGKAGLVPVPQITDKDKFLKGDGNWSAIDIPSFNTDVFSIDNNEVSLAGFDFAETGSTLIKTSNGLEWAPAATGKLNRKITTKEKLQAQLNGTDEEPIDENAIYMVLNNNSTQPNQYDEYMIIDNKLELLGTFGEVELDNYVTIPTFNTTINTLENVLYDTIDTTTNSNVPGLISRVSLIENNYITQAQIGDLSTLNLSEGNETLVEEVNTLSDRLKWHELSI